MNSDERYATLFVPATGRRLELFLGERTNRLPPGYFFARLRYDMESDADMAALIESVLLPGGRSSVER